MYSCEYTIVCPSTLKLMIVDNVLNLCVFIIFYNRNSVVRQFFYLLCSCTEHDYTSLMTSISVFRIPQAWYLTVLLPHVA